MEVKAEGVHDEVDDNAAAPADARQTMNEHALSTVQQLRQQRPRQRADCQCVNARGREERRVRSPATMSDSMLSSMGKL